MMIWMDIGLAILAALSFTDPWCETLSGWRPSRRHYSPLGFWALVGAAMFISALTWPLLIGAMIKGLMEGRRK